MPTYLSPGIYTRETDFSFYVKQISTSSAAMVGVAEKGPINKPVLVTSWEQFINRFGSYINESYLAYAARAFFDNGGSVLYVNRIAHLTDPTDRDTLTAVKSSIVLQNRETTPADALRIEAMNEGVWGDRLSVSIEDGSLDPANLQHGGPAQRQRGRGVQGPAMDETQPNHVELAINERSDYITGPGSLRHDGNARRTVRHWACTRSPAATTASTDLADADYIGDPSQHTGIYAFDEIDALNMLMVPGVTTAPVINAGHRLCRGPQGPDAHRRHADPPGAARSGRLPQGPGDVQPRGVQLVLRRALLPVAGDQRPGQLAQEAGSALRRGGRVLSPAATRRPTSGTRPPASTGAASSTRSRSPTRPAVASATCSIPKASTSSPSSPTPASTSGASGRCRASPRRWTASTCAA